MPGPEQGSKAGVAGFGNTHWSLVLAANRADSPGSEEALAQLCQAYWYPIYAFIRRRGNDPESAKDLTQEFFSRLLAKQYLRGVDRDRGRFRTFLMCCVEHFLCNENKKGQALKRGGGIIFVPLGGAGAEERYQVEPADTMAPDKLLERRWAMTLLELSFGQLKEKYVNSGKGDQFEVLQSFLSGTKEAPCSFADVGARLGMSEAAARQAASRMRSLFGELLRQNVAQTVTSPQELEAELNHLRSVLSSCGGEF